MTAAEDPASAAEPQESAHHAPTSIGADEALLERALGGWRGMIDSGVPTLVFVTGYLLTGQQLRPSLLAALTSGLVIAVWRLVRRESLQQVLTGFLGVAISAFVASRTGRAENFFVLGLLTNVVYGAAFLVSVLVRWPLMGVLVGSFRMDPSGWRERPAEYSAYVTASWVWVAMFGLRLLVQLPMYLAGWVGLLGVAKLVMGWPLFLLAAYLSYRIVHPVLAEAEAARVADATAAEAGIDPAST